MRLRESAVTGKAAIKSVKADAPIEEHQGFLREASTMAQFEHNNVIRLHGMILVNDNTSTWMCIEFMAGGDLKNFLEKARPLGWPHQDTTSKLKILDMLQISIDLAKGLEYLSTLDFVHRDIAARNCLISNTDFDSTDRITKIADFGLSRQTEDDSNYYRMDSRGLGLVK